ncbi:MAG TPA: PDZ domain-containing protein [Longimicrobium sp.]|nr:PDZ domain-containing protein [Longimicrobium sp.]
MRMRDIGWMMVAGAALTALAGPLRAQNAGTDTIRYTLRIDSLDLSGFDVEMRVPDAPPVLRLAMAAHPEYDERFWRYLRGLSADVDGAAAAVSRVDSAVWEVRSAGGEVAVRYRIVLPPHERGFRPSWRPVLTAAGGLVGGPDSFLYVADQPRRPTRLHLELPRGWTRAGIPAEGPWSTPTFAELMDAPILVGRLRTWRFQAGGASHTVAYLPAAEGVPFDTAAVVRALEGLTVAARDAFGGLPYAEYAFLLQDGAWGGLEHAHSVTLGASSAELAQGMDDFLENAAHEYVHTWNLVRLRPAGWIGLGQRPPPPTGERWWSEGVTIYFADLLLRRAGLAPASSRLDRLARDLAEYLDNPGYRTISPEAASRASSAAPGPREATDYYLHGRLVATALDFALREATGGRRGIDELMRRMVARYPLPRGYTGADLERTAGEVCGCDMRPFFARYVRAPGRLELAPQLASLGLRMRVRRDSVTDAQGRLAPDLRVWADAAEAGPVRLLVGDPRSAWARAGLRTGDEIVSLAGTPIAGMNSFRRTLRSLRAGQSAVVAYRRGGRASRVTVRIGGYSRLHVTFSELPGSTEAQRSRRAAWLAGELPIDRAAR